MSDEPSADAEPSEASDAGPQRPQATGGTGAVLGFRLISLSGVQGVALVTSNMLQLATIGVIAGVLGASDLGRYSLLLFLGALLTMIFSLAAKPGTIRRTFGGGDDEDDDEEEEEVVSASPKRTLGAGLIWAAVLGVIASGLVVVFREQIAGWLLGEGTDPDLVLWAGVLGAGGILFKVASIALWFERRPTAFLIAEISRPVVTLAIMIPMLASGGGLGEAIAAAAAGNVVSSLLAVALLRGSFEPNFEPAEVFAIFKGGGRRVPIVSSLWVIQNADVFILSRFVDHTDLGIYALAARLGFVVSFFPQGFRMALRPLRKSAVFKAVREQYGRPIADGQLLGYFVLVCISSVLLMVLGGQLVIDIAPPEFERAAPLIPLTALALTMPALWRTVHAQTSWPGKTRLVFIIATLSAAAMFVGACMLLAPEIGIYAAPVAMLIGFVIPITYFFVRCQLSENRIDFPYAAIGKALAAAVVIAVAFWLLPSFHPIGEALLIALLMGLYAFLLLVLRVIPENHWPALSEMVTSMFTGRADRFNPRGGLRVLTDDDRTGLQRAVREGMTAGELARPARVPVGVARRGKAPNEMAEGTEGGRLVWALRCAGRAGGAPVKRKSRWDDGQVAEFLFANEPPAVRAATMRALLADGAEAVDLRALEDLVKHLSKIPDDAWEGAAARKSPQARRRKAVGRRGRAAASRAARAIGRRL